MDWECPPTHPGHHPRDESHGAAAPASSCAIRGACHAHDGGRLRRREKPNRAACSLPVSPLERGILGSFPHGKQCHACPPPPGLSPLGSALLSPTALTALDGMSVWWAAIVEGGYGMRTEGHEPVSHGGGWFGEVGRTAGLSRLSGLRAWYSESAIADG